MSFVTNQYVKVFPITNQRVQPNSDAHHITEHRLVNWLSQLVDKKAFVVNTSENMTFTPAENSTSTDEFVCFIDGYFVSISKKYIEEWLKNNSTSENVYAFLNISNGYLLGDIIPDGLSSEYYYTPIQIRLPSSEIEFNNVELKHLFSQDDGALLEGVVIRLNTNTNYRVMIKDGLVEIESALTFNNESSKWEFTPDGETQTLFEVNSEDTSSVEKVTLPSNITFDTGKLTVQAVYPKSSFQGLELSTSDNVQSSVQFDTNPNADAVPSTVLHILKKQSENIYVVPKASKLKFESYSINVDGGEV